MTDQKQKPMFILGSSAGQMPTLEQLIGLCRLLGREPTAEDIEKTRALIAKDVSQEAARAHRIATRRRPRGDAARQVRRRAKRSEKQ